MLDKREAWAQLAPVVESIRATLDVEEILRMYRSGMTQVDIANELHGNYHWKPSVIKSAVHRLLMDELDPEEQETLEAQYESLGGQRGYEAGLDALPHRTRSEFSRRAGKSGMARRRKEGTFEEFCSAGGKASAEKRWTLENRTEIAINSIENPSVDPALVAAMYMTPETIRVREGAPVSLEQLAGYFGCSKILVQKMLQKAVELDILSTEDRAAERSYRMSYYRKNKITGR